MSELTPHPTDTPSIARGQPEFVRSDIPPPPDIVRQGKTTQPPEDDDHVSFFIVSEASDRTIDLPAPPTLERGEVEPEPDAPASPPAAAKTVVAARSDKPDDRATIRIPTDQQSHAPAETRQTTPAALEIVRIGDSQVVINRNNPDQVLTRQFLDEFGLPDASWSVPVPEIRGDVEKSYFQDTYPYPTFFAKQVEPIASEAVPAPQPAEVLKSAIHEMQLLPAVREVVQSAPVQQLVADGGFSGLYLVEPIAAMVDDTGVRTTLYPYQEGSIAEGVEDGEAVLPGSELAAVTAIVDDLKAKLIERGVIPQDLSPEQILINRDPSGEATLHLVDTEHYKMPNPQAVVPAVVEMHSMETQKLQATAILRTADRAAMQYLGRDQYVRDAEGVFAPAIAELILPCLAAAQPRPGEQFLDIGSGEGRWVLVAAGALGLEAYGYELSRDRHAVAERILQVLREQRVMSAQQAARVHLVQGDVRQADISQADIISFFDGSVPVLGKIRREAKPGARLIIYGDRSVPGQRRDPAFRLITDRIKGVRIPASIYQIVRPT